MPDAVGLDTRAAAMYSGAEVTGYYTAALAQTNKPKQQPGEKR